MTITQQRTDKGFHLLIERNGTHYKTDDYKSMNYLYNALDKGLKSSNLDDNRKTAILKLNHIGKYILEL